MAGQQSRPDPKQAALAETHCLTAPCLWGARTVPTASELQFS